MRSPRSLVALGVALVGAGAILWAVASRERPQAPAIVAPSTGPVGKAAISAPAGPALGSAAEAPSPVAPVAIDTGGSAAAAPALPGIEAAAPATGSGAAPAGDTLAQAFAREARDPSWAGDTEGELRRRTARVGAVVARAECRASTCALDLAGSEGAVADAVAHLESRAGLQGLASSLYLVRGADGVRVYARFERP